MLEFRLPRVLNITIVFALTVALRTFATARDETPAGITSIVPVEDFEVVLHNPEMGWLLYENYPIDQQPNGSSTMVTLPDETFASVDHVALMFSWADIEREQDRFDFAKVRHAYDHWRQRGKQIQLRLSAESLLWWSGQDPPAGQGVPGYVLAQVAPERRETRKFEGLSYTVVDARDAYYGERLRRFLEAVAEEFSTDRPVTLIDLRGFGLWGEWHSGYRYRTLDDRRAALSRVVDIWSQAFPRHFLSLSYSYDPDGPREFFAGSRIRVEESATLRYAEYVRFSAFDYALTKPKITLRRDGCGGAVTSNERRLCNEAFATRSKGPFVSEFLGGYQQAKKGGDDWVRWMIDDALSLHPNYVNLLGWQGADARDFLRERPDLIAHGLREMGYRLVPVSVEYPSAIETGTAFVIGMSWVNRGAGRALRDWTIRFHLHDREGRSIARHDGGVIKSSQWIKGEIYAVNIECIFPETKPGDYELRLTLIDGTSKRPIMLPLADRHPDGSYRLGRASVVARGR